MVVSTVSPITSLVENVGGARIRLEGIVPEGVNSHTFEPAPSVATARGRGGPHRPQRTISGGTISPVGSRSNKKPDAVILTLADKADNPATSGCSTSRSRSRDGHPNPHLWTSPDLAVKYAELIRAELSSLDPENADYYSAETYAEARRAAERPGQAGLQTAVSTIPPENRKAAHLPRFLPLFQRAVWLRRSSARRSPRISANRPRERWRR